MYLLFNEKYYADCAISVDRIRINFELSQKICETIRSNDNSIDHLINAPITYDARNSDYIKGSYKFYDSTDHMSALMFYLKVSNNGFIEFNPNKLFNCCGALEAVCDFLNKCAVWKCQRFDIAIDLPTDFSELTPIKDNRNLMMYVRSFKKDNYTVYWGSKRNAIGTAKMYNKALESGMDKPLTRIELTVGNKDEKGWINKLHNTYPIVFRKSKEIEQNAKLTKTDKAFIRLFNSCGDKSEAIAAFCLLDRKKRDKLQPYIHGDKIYFEKYDDIICEVIDRMIEILSD